MYVSALQVFNNCTDENKAMDPLGLGHPVLSDCRDASTEPRSPARAADFWATELLVLILYAGTGSRFSLTLFNVGLNNEQFYSDMWFPQRETQIQSSRVWVQKGNAKEANTGSSCLCECVHVTLHTWQSQVQVYLLEAGFLCSCVYTSLLV